MTHPTPPVAAQDPRSALGRAVGMAAFLWGYPLIEAVRTCRLQTHAQAGAGVTWRAAIDTLHHARQAATADDRDVVTPANDLLYTTGWIHLAHGPRLLQVPSSRQHGGRYFVLALYDAWTNNFSNPGSRASPPEGETLCLVGPDTPEDFRAPAGTRLLRSPTHLVWLIARVVVGEGDDALPARALQDDIRLQCPEGTGAGQPPPCVAQWVGAPEEIVAALDAAPGRSDAIAGDFFRNLCQSLQDLPPPSGERGLLAWFAAAHITPGGTFDWQTLEPALREGLHQGLLDGVALLRHQSRSRVARPWATSWGIGVYGQNYLVRALTAYKGLGALASEEAVYAMGDYDGDKQLLDGRKAYALHFAADDLPPVDAFWSLTLYAADRFLHPNPLRRFSLGDRSEGLRRDTDGGLTLRIGHQGDAADANWLPAPAGPFYVVLRMYGPRPDARAWRIPPLREILPSR